MDTILIGRITLLEAAMVEAQDLRSGTHNDARFEKSNRETLPSAVRNCGNQSNKTSDLKKPNDSRLRQRSLELVARHSSATAEARITKTSDSNTAMRVAR